MAKDFFDECSSRNIMDIVNEEVAAGRVEDAPSGLYLVEYDQIFSCRLNEWNIDTGFNVGDRVRHKRTGREYTVFAVPYCDYRELGGKDQSTFDGKDVYDMCYYGNALWVKDDAGNLDPESGPSGLSALSCQYFNFEKI